MTTREKKKKRGRADERRARITDRKKRLLFISARGRNEGKEKRFVIYVPGKLSPPPVTNCRTKQKRKKSYLVKIQLAAHVIRSPLYTSAVSGMIKRACAIRRNERVNEKKKESTEAK